MPKVRRLGHRERLAAEAPRPIDFRGRSTTIRVPGNVLFAGDWTSIDCFGFTASADCQHGCFVRWHQSHSQGV